MTAEVIARRLVIHGRVQGVFFRDTLRRVAEEAEVAGWAENRDDGTVEVVLEGGRQGVERVVAFCEDGPERALVERVEVREVEAQGLTGFAIR